MRNVPLKTRVALITAALGLVTVMASGSLVLLTAWLNIATEELGGAVESVHLAHQSVQDLLLLPRAHDAVVSAELESSLHRNLMVAQGRIVTLEEGAALARAATAVNAYLASPTANGGTYESAYTALRDLAAMDVDRARALTVASRRWEHLADIVGTFCAVMVPAILLGLVGALDRWLRPVLQLRRAMERYAAGDTEVRAPATGPSEIREMAQRFNELTEKLARQRETEIAFLAGVAHDLRNPVGALRLAATAARSGSVDPARLLEICGRQVDHLDRMIGDLLDLARVHGGKLTLDLQEHDLRDVSRQVVELFSLSAHHVPIALDLPDEPVVTRCDGTRIGQVLGNLVSNAMKYSPEGAEIRVCLRAVEGHARLAVSDHGRGIAPSELQAVFEPFRRGLESGPPVAGAGMGLYVARRIVEGHGGRLDVQSEPGRGSTFTVELPLPDAATRERREARHAQGAALG